MSGPLSPSSTVPPGANAPVEAPPTTMTAPGEIINPVTATAEAKRIAGAILDVFAGVRSISDTALMLGIASARYYTLEARALAGFIAACEPRLRGAVPGASLQGEIDRLRLERDRLRDEAARYQTLARIAASAFGTPTPSLGAGVNVNRQAQSSPAATTRATLADKSRKKRRASVRALRLSQNMRATVAGTESSASSTVLPSAASTNALRVNISTGEHAGG